MGFDFFRYGVGFRARRSWAKSVNERKRVNMERTCPEDLLVVKNIANMKRKMAKNDTVRPNQVLLAD